MKYLYGYYRTAAVLSRSVPRPFAYWIGLRAADYFYRRNGPDRQAVTSNLRHIYQAKGIDPGSEVLDGVVRKTYQYFGKYLVDFFRFTRLSQRELGKLVSFEHLEYLDDMLAQGRGVVAISAHFGNWELGGAVLAAKGYTFHTVFLPERLEKVNEFFYKTRSQRGFNLVPYGSAARDLYRLLRRGQLVSLLADRDFSGRNDRVPFFGKLARFPRGPGLLAMRTGAPVVPGFVIRQVDDTFLLRMHKPIDPRDCEDEKELLGRIAQVLEQEVGEHPHQWFLFEDFWRD
jgi:KDO2-lipid IV(A) lauroyltransferase